jgi:hypothetical protein
MAVLKNPVRQVAQMTVVGYWLAQAVMLVHLRAW